MSSDMDPIVKSAIEWHVRLSGDDSAAWEAFADWLEADPRHAEAYDRVEALAGQVDALLPATRAAATATTTDDRPIAARRATRRKFLYWGSGAAAASLLAALLWMPGAEESRYEIATAPGETRVVKLDAATEVAVNGGTRIIFDRTDPRFASLQHGQALFRIEHDEARPFVVEIGEARVVDLGTVFDIRRGPGDVRVAVSEGKVEYRANGKTVDLAPGEQLTALKGRDPVVSATARDAVGAWERGQLLYSGAPLSEVAADLSRALGQPIEVAPAIATRPFSGNLTISGNGAAEMARLGLALDVHFSRTRTGWSMGPVRSAGE